MLLSLDFCLDTKVDKKSRLALFLEQSYQYPDSARKRRFPILIPLLTLLSCLVMVIVSLCNGYFGAFSRENLLGRLACLVMVCTLHLLAHDRHLERGTRRDLATCNRCYPTLTVPFLQPSSSRRGILKHQQFPLLFKEDLSRLFGRVRVRFVKFSSCSPRSSSSRRRGY